MHGEAAYPLTEKIRFALIESLNQNYEEIALAVEKRKISGELKKKRQQILKL